MNMAERAARGPSMPCARSSRANGAFLLLKDSKSSYVIEGERPPAGPHTALGPGDREAGRAPLDLDELLRLQRIVIGDERFVRLGLRQEGGFVGEHDRDSRTPIPNHISARPEDLPSLVQGMIAFDRSADREDGRGNCRSRAFLRILYVHPFADGNGRIHRYLMHHVLARRGFNPAESIFQCQRAILERIDDIGACWKATRRAGVASKTVEVSVR